MDSNCTTEELPTEKTRVEERDIISKLHESTLSQIISFLQPKEAIHTCVLSKSWINIWKSITTLNFDDTLVYSDKKNMQKEQFVNFVNKVLLHLSDSSIQSFSLCLKRFQYDASQVSEWISFILERRIQKLHIQYFDYKVTLSSHSLFSCSSLVELVLQMRCTLKLPEFACLSNLQNINISGIKIVSDSSTYTEDLVLSFLHLKVFEARGCEWSTMQNISIQSPLLERFFIANWRSLSDRSCKSAIKIFCPRITDFSYEGDLEQNISLHDCSSIRNASIVIVIEDDKNDKMESLGIQANTLLRQIRNVEGLKLLCYKVLSHAKDIFNNLPSFGRLTYLQLNEVTGEALLQLLHNSPILNTLVLLNGVSDLNKDVLTSASVPHCFLSSFKVFQFKSYNVKEEELCLVNFMIGNAAILERVTISLAFWLRYADIDIEKVKKQILSLPKCSNFCMVEFSDINCP